MRERKYVRVRVDMYDDTKFKIIDMKPERDLIHYVWTRIVTLAGKINLDGDLYLSKNIPYTVETLAIEFNRDVTEIKLAIEVLVELEMIELNEENAYRVKNFAKHQNIKVKEKSTIKDKEKIVRNEEVISIESFEDENKNNEDAQDKIDQDPVKSTTVDKIEFSENAVSKDSVDGKLSNKENDEVPMCVDAKKKTYKRKKKSTSRNKGSSITDEEVEDISVCSFIDGDFQIPLGTSDSVKEQWSFGT